jgi:hypothetical protein
LSSLTIFDDDIEFTIDDYMNDHRYGDKHFMPHVGEHYIVKYIGNPTYPMVKPNCNELLFSSETQTTCPMGMPMLTKRLLKAATGDIRTVHYDILTIEKRRLLEKDQAYLASFG